MTHKLVHIFVEEHPYKVVIRSTNGITYILVIQKKNFYTKANIDRIKLDRTPTSRKAINDCIKALTIVFKPIKNQ